MFVVPVKPSFSKAHRKAFLSTPGEIARPSGIRLSRPEPFTRPISRKIYRYVLGKQVEAVLARVLAVRLQRRASRLAWMAIGSCTASTRDSCLLWFEREVQCGISYAPCPVIQGLRLTTNNREDCRSNCWTNDLKEPPNVEGCTLDSNVIYSRNQVRRGYEQGANYGTPSCRTQTTLTGSEIISGDREHEGRSTCRSWRANFENTRAWAWRPPWRSKLLQGL